MPALVKAARDGETQQDFGGGQHRMWAGLGGERKGVAWGDSIQVSHLAACIDEGSLRQDAGGGTGTSRDHAESA